MSPSAASQLEASASDYSPSPSNLHRTSSPQADQQAGSSRSTGNAQQYDSDGGNNPTSTAPGSYNALEYRHLNVSDDIRDLFKYIGRYKPNTIDIETKLKPFIPDYLPAVGGIDEFIKVPRPDGKPDFLGLKVGHPSLTDSMTQVKQLTA